MLFDSVLVLDRSGSMADPAGSRRKIEALQVAADLFVHEWALRNIGDRLGLVRYDHENDIYLGLDVIGAQSLDPYTPGPHLATAEDKLSIEAIDDPDRLKPRGATWIGGAMLTAAELLLSPQDLPGERTHVMIVLSDGIENQSPTIGEVVGDLRDADPDLRMYSVGLGNEFNATALQAITNETHGYHQVTDDLSGTTIFDLEAFYFKIFTDTTDMDLVIDPTHLVTTSGSDPIVVDMARIITSDRIATFLVLDEPRNRKMYSLELVTPDGAVLNTGSSIDSIPVHRLDRYNYSIFRVMLPPPERMGPFLGDWKLRLVPRKKTGGRALVPVGFAAAVKSDFRMHVGLHSSTQEPGAEVVMSATLKDRGWPLTTGIVEVDVTTPSGNEFRGIRLVHEGTDDDVLTTDGVRTGKFINTHESGTYKFFYRANVLNRAGEATTRQATRYLTLSFPRKPVKEEDGCLPCWLRILLWVLPTALLIFLITWLLRYGLS